MTIRGLSVREWVDKAAPALIVGLIVWAVGLYAWQRETTRRMDEMERQNLKQWESIDRIRSEGDLTEIKEWKRIMEPLIKKGAGL